MSRLSAVRERLGNMSQKHPLAVRVGKWIVGIVVSIVALIVALWLLVLWVGLIDAIIYAVLFTIGLAIVPFAIALLGHDIPMNGAIGRLHVLLGAIGFNHHYLVDLGDKWEWCPGDAKRVYIDGKWYGIEGGFENRSVLGWRPFGILRFKDDDTLANVRADTAAERARDGRGRGVSADGGAVEVKRGGYQESEPPTETGIDGTWVVDLKRLFSRGVKKIGDTELVETAEEVIERGEISGPTFEGWRQIIGAITGLLLGVVVGYMTFLG